MMVSLETRHESELLFPIMPSSGNDIPYFCLTNLQ
jgi:hypothetical protein